MWHGLRFSGRHPASLILLGAAAATLALARPTAAVPQAPETGGDIGRTVVSLGQRTAESSFVPGAEAALLTMLNRCRAAHHLPRLLMDASLRGAAREHSRDMALGGFVGHGSLRGQSFLDRLDGAVPPGTLVGENVTVAQTADEANRAFLASPGHLKNILDPAFRSVGIGVATAGPLGMAVTEDFAQ